MRSITERLVSPEVKPKVALPVIVLLVIMTHLPTGFSGFVADDYMQWAMLQGSEQLLDRGISKADPDKAFWQKLSDGFHFFSPDSGTNQAYRDYGNLFWWASPDASMVPFRPIAAATHWFDYRFYGNAIELHRLHSLVYFLFLVLSVYFLYRKLTPDQSIVFLATLLIVVDFSFTRSFAWVVARNSILGCGFGVVAIFYFIQWRQQQTVINLLLVLGFLLAAILTAEAAICAVAYMGAYVLCRERQPLLKKALVLLPLVALLIIWRIIYNQYGFGASGIGQYIDPGRSPIEFINNFIAVFPLIYLSLATGLDTLIIFIHPEKRWLVSLFAWVLLLACIYIIWPTIKRNDTARILFVGSVVAAIPGTALISAESRTVTFVSIGFFFLLAHWLVALYKQRHQFLKRWVFRIVVLWHVVLPALAAFLLTANVSSFDQGTNQYQSVERAIKGERSLVVVNPRASGMLFYLPFEWAFHGYTVPKKLNVLSPGLNTVTLTRLSERHYVVDSVSGMPLHHKANFQLKNTETPFLSGAYTGIYTQSFFVTPEAVPRQGDVIRNADMEVTINQIDSVGPVQVSIVFVGDEHPDHKVWQWFDWESGLYKHMQPLAVGESRTFPGPLAQ